MPGRSGVSLPTLCQGGVFSVKFTRYFMMMSGRPDRAMIDVAWIQQVVDAPIREMRQQDGRIRRWGHVAEVDRYLRVVLLPDGETVHNAFFDRRFSV
jgi:hypothetical protein